MWELDCEESWAQKNWCFWTVVLEKTLESPLDCKEIQPVHPTGDHSWVFIGRTDVEAETPIFWSPDVKSWLIWKDPDAGKHWGQEEKGMTEDEMVEWHHWLNGHEFRGWWWTGRPGVLQFMGLKRVGHDWPTELNWDHFEPCPPVLPEYRASPLFPSWCLQQSPKWSPCFNSYLGNSLHSSQQPEASFKNIRPATHVLKPLWLDDFPSQLE